MYGTKFEVVVTGRPQASGLTVQCTQKRTMRVQCRKSKVLGFNLKVIFQLGSRNPPGYASADPAPGRSSTQEEQADLGFDEVEDD